MDDVFGMWMEKIQADPAGALGEFIGVLEGGKRTAKVAKTVAIGKRMLADPDNRREWQAGASSFEEAVQFYITNTLMKGAGLGVIRQDVSLDDRLNAIFEEDGKRDNETWGAYLSRKQALNESVEEVKEIKTDTDKRHEELAQLKEEALNFEDPGKNVKEIKRQNRIYERIFKLEDELE